MWDDDKREELGVQESLGSLFSRVLLPYQKLKDKRYDSSWARRGLYGYVYGCLLRQVDRIEPGWEAIRSLEKSHDPSRSSIVLNFFDTLYDVGMYALMGIRLLGVYFPSEYEEFLRSRSEEVDEQYS